jgi:hypothetical protein
MPHKNRHRNINLIKYQGVYELIAFLPPALNSGLFLTRCACNLKGIWLGDDIVFAVIILDYRACGQALSSQSSIFCQERQPRKGGEAKVGVMRLEGWPGLQLPFSIKTWS